MKNIQNLTIDINKKPFQSLTANVGEVASRFIRITILDNNMPADLTGVTAYLYVKKANGTKVFNSVKVEDAKQGIVLAELTSQVLAVPGLARLTLLLTKDGAKLASKQIIVTVDESNVDEEAIQSSNEFNAFTEALKKVDNIETDYNSLKKVIIDENATANLQNQINKLVDGSNVRIVKSEKERDDIDVKELKNGVLCYVISSDKYYKYKDGEWDIFGSGTGGGGTGSFSAYISTTLPEDVMVNIGEYFNLIIDFSSPNAGKGTLKVFINDVDSLSTSINQGESITKIPSSLLSKGNNRVVVYVLDRTGQMSNSLTFYVRYGSMEIISDFDPYVSYDYRSTIRYYFTPTALDTSSTLTFYMRIDGEVQKGVSCVSDTRGYYTFPNNLTADSHYCEAWIEDNAGKKSNILAFNLIILDTNTIVAASDAKNITVEEGEQISLDYKIYMKNNNSFITRIYIDDELVNTGTCGLDFNYFKTSSLKEGIHNVKLEVWDITETYYDYVTWTISVTPSTYEMLQPVNAGAMFIGTAVNKTNTDERKQYFIGQDQEGSEVLGTLTNFAYNSESGWVNDELIISGNSHVEIPIQPLANNARYGFTLDIEFTSKQIGVEDAEVLTLWNDEKDCGIKITTEKIILRSAEGNECNLYYSDNERTNVIFVIDRQERKAKIYLNGVMCEAFHLNDYSIDSVSYLEDFTVNSNIFLGGHNKNGYCKIRNLRVYEVALTTDEILNNWMSCETDKGKQRELVEFQKGNDLPTLTVYCDFSGLGKDDKKPCKIVYNSTDEVKYGKSFTLDHKQSQLQYQGTSSMAYPIKNYRLNLRNEDGSKLYYKLPGSQPECRFTLKADFMNSCHAHNTGMAKFINDNLYNYNLKDEKSMNPFKWNHIQNGGDINDFRETINGFPCRLILVNDGESPLNEGQNEPTPGNTKDMGIFNFNNDKDNVTTLGFNSDIFPNCASYEVTANSDTSAGAFMSYNGDGDKADELAYLKESFELRHPDEDDVAEDWGFMGVGEEGTGLKGLIDWVDNCTDEEFVRDFEQHFHKDYTLRYYALVVLIGAVDNLGKNMMLDTADNKIFFPRFYDIDTILSYDNSGDIKFDVDIEMEQGYWNTSSSRLWTRIRDLMHDDIVAIYNDMRKNGVSYENMMKYLYDEQIAKIPQAYYNKDYDIKYAPFEDSYIGMAHGNGYEHMKRWLKNRFIFCDTLFDYAPSYNNDVLTIRANTTELMNIEIETYTPVYQHISWYNGQMDKKKIDGKVSTAFSGTAMTATDQEVLIYGGSNIKRIKGISSMNPNQMLIGSATKLIELDASNSPLLVDINSNKANLSPHTYLNKVNLSNCPQLGGNLRLNNSPLIQEVDMRGTNITGLNLPSSIRNLQVLRLPNTITELTLNDAGMLHTLEFDEGVNLQSVSMTNCNALENVTGLDLLQTPSITLNNSYNNVAELYFRDTTNLSLSNMPNLERVIFTPNNEYEAFELINVANAPDYKVTTFNCPKLSTFMTTAPYRESYNNGEYGDIQPNTTFTANSIDISNTQFTDVKLLCTTDTNTLKLPTTVKNFYCDSSFDLDTDYLEDGEYDVVHGELVEPYTNDYESEVLLDDVIERRYSRGEIDYTVVQGSDYMTDKIPIENAYKLDIFFEVSSQWQGVKFLDKDENLLSEYGGAVAARTIEVPSDAKWMNIWCNNGINMKQGYRLYFKRTPNLIPSSADGSLIFSMYAPNNTVAPASGIWDLKGLKFDNFHTFGMNNDVKPNDDSFVEVADVSNMKVFTGGSSNNMQYGNVYYDIGKINTRCITNIKLPAGHYTIKRSDGGAPTVYASATPDGIQTVQYNMDLGETFDTDRYVTICLNKDYFPITINDVQYRIEDMELVDTFQILKETTGKDSGNIMVSDYGSTIYTHGDNIFKRLDIIQSLSMPARYDDYNITIKNANISPKTHNTMLYPLLVNEDNPITGTLDYTNYAGKHLSWAFAYTDLDKVQITQPREDLLNSYEYRYNAFYDTEYEFENPYEIARYTSSTSGVLPSFNTEFTYTYDEIDNGDGTYTTKVYADSLDNLPTNISFSGKTTLLTVDKLNTSNVTNMSYMFRDCNNLTSINLSGFGTSNVTDMSYMFYSCTRLTSLDLSNFDTSNVTTMRAMFQICNSLTSLDLSNFDTSNVTNMLDMFSACSGLTSLDVSGFDTSKVADMSNMFNGCSGLTSLPITTFGNNTNYSQLYNACHNITSIPTLTITGPCSLHRLFARSANLPSSITFDWQTDEEVNVSGMFCDTPREKYESLYGFNLTSCGKTIFTGYFFGGISGVDARNFKNFTCTGTLNHSIDLSPYPNLSEESLTQILNCLCADGTGLTLTMGATNLAKITEDQIAIATNKGWTVA